MTTPNLCRLLVLWEDAFEQGQFLSAAELCRDQPQLAGELGQAIDAMRRIKQLACVHSPLPASETVDQSPYINSSKHVEAVAGSFGRYQVIGEIARGGMGIVYRARDPQLDRVVAFKVMLDSDCERSAALKRFVAEARITGQLQHPGIVPVYECGEFPPVGIGEPRAYFAMKLIEGRTLAELLRERATPVQDLPKFLKIFEQICQALAYSHSRGVIHRDLKPANIMVGEFGEVQVMDWGLAKYVAATLAPTLPSDTAQPLTAAKTEAEPNATIDPDATTAPACVADDRTQAGSVMGTPAYMAPEQARGEIDNLGPHTDVFALGAILCEVLTARAPFSGQTGLETIKRAAAGDMEEALTALAKCGADAELIELAKRCLAVELVNRPADGRAVAESVAAYQTSVEERFRSAERARAAAEAKAVEERKRRRVQLILAASVVLFLGVGAVGAWWIQKQAAERERTAELRRERIAIAVMTTLQQLPELYKRGLWKQAEALLDQTEQQAGPDAPAEQREQLAQARANLRFLAKLDHIRQEKLVMSEGRVAPEVANPMYQEAFQNAGYDLMNGNEAVLIESLRSSPIREALLAVLEDWALDEKAERQQRLDRILARTSGDDWRGELYQLKHDSVSLKRRVLELERNGGPPALFLRLAGMLDSVRASVRLLEAGSRFHPTNVWLHLHRAVRQSISPDPRPDQEVGPLQAALALRPENAILWNNLGYTLARMGDFDGAVAALNRAIQIDPKYVGAHNNLGHALRCKGDLDGAIAAHRVALEIDPKHAPAHNNLGVAFMDKGDIDGALAAFRSAIRADPNDPSSHNNLGMVLKDLGDIDGAIAAHRTAIAINPRFARSHNSLGFVLKMKGDLAGAIAAYRAAIQADPKYSSAHNNLGVALRAKGDIDGAIAAGRTAVQHDPKDVLAYFNLGVALKDKGDLDEALAAYRSAIKINPRYAIAYYGIGGALRAKGDTDGAIAAQRAAIQLDPKYGPAHNSLGLALRDQGDLNGAIAAYLNAIQIDPKDAKAHTNLGAALRDKGEIEAAMVAYQNAIQADSKYANPHGGLGRCLLDQGRFNEAHAAFQRGLELLSEKDPQRNNWVPLLQRCNHLLDVERDWPGIRSGMLRPNNPSQLVETAFFATKYRGHHLLAALLYRDAFAADLKLVIPHLNDAIRSAVRAAIGEGEDASALSPEEALYVLSLASRRMISYLAPNSKGWDKATPQTRQSIQRRLTEWQTDPALAPVRDPEKLAALPESERKQWQQIWADVRALQERAIQREMLPMPKELP